MPNALINYYKYMALLWAILFLIVALILIAKSADLIVHTSVNLAKRLGISEFNIGFFVIGLATTTPEFFVGLQSAIDGNPQLSLGNLIGASIVLLTLIVGVNAVFSGEVLFIKTFSQKDMWLTSFVIVAPAFLLWDESLSRPDGLLLLTLYLIFYRVMNKEQSFTEHLKHSFDKPHHHTLRPFAILVLGIAGLLVSSKIIVEAAEFIAVSLNIPYVVIGLLLLSIGTNLPELTVLFSTLKNRQQQIGIGDFLGSALANTPVLGLVALIYPIHLEAPLKVFLSLGMLFLALLTFNAYFSIDKKINRLEGISLVALYAFFIFTELYLKNQL